MPASSKIINVPVVSQPNDLNVYSFSDPKVLPTHSRADARTGFEPVRLKDATLHSSRKLYLYLPSVYETNKERNICKVFY